MNSKPFPAYRGDESYVFVSYAHKDSDAVFPELVWLNQLGINIWYDEGIEAGTEWRDEIAHAIDAANAFIYFVSPSSVASENCRKELNYAIDQQATIFTVHLEKTELRAGLKLTLSDRQAILKYELSQSEYERKLVQPLTKQLDLKQPLAPTQPPSTKKRNIRFRTILAALALLVAIGGVALYDYFQMDDISIAILPFQSLSTEGDLEHIATAIADEIHGNLADEEFCWGPGCLNFKTAPRRETLRLIEEGRSIAGIASDLNVNYLLEGTIRQTGTTLTITPQIIRVRDSSYIWSTAYQRTRSDDLDFQQSMGKYLAFMTRNLVGFDQFIQFFEERNFWYQFRAGEHAALATRERFLLDIGEGGDREFIKRHLRSMAEADGALTYPYTALAGLIREDSSLPRVDRIAESQRALDKAKAIEPESFDLLIQQAMHNLFARDNAAADLLFVEALERPPDAVFYAFAYLGRAWVAAQEYRFRDAARHLDTVSSLSPEISLAVVETLNAWLQWTIGNNNASIRIGSEALSLYPGGEPRARLLRNLAVAQLSEGNLAEVERLANEAWEIDVLGNHIWYVTLFGHVGETDRAREILSKVGQTEPNAIALAIAYDFFGEKDTALQSLSRAINNDAYGTVGDLLLFIRAWNWVSVKDEPRFEELLSSLESTYTHTPKYETRVR